jgi:PAS domain S-box-containing protein
MSGKKILIVEDESIVAMDIKCALEGLGFTVCSMVSSGEEAVTTAAENKPDLILMDIMLKGEMDGVEAAKWIHENLDIPVIFLTAYTDPTTLERAKQTEPYGYLVKPFEERELNTAIEVATYKHQTEREIRESRRWLSTTLESIGEAVIAADRNGTIQLINPVAEALTGWERSEATGKHIDEVLCVGDEEHDAIGAMMNEVLDGGEKAELPNGARICCRAGSDLPVGGTIARIKDEKGNAMGMILVFRDMTEHLKRQEELLRAQKLESVGLLAGGIAHDFNNILVGILGGLTQLRLCTRENADLSRILAIAEKACLQAKSLTQQLLTFAKGGRPLKRPEDITSLIGESSEFALSGSNIRCEIQAEQDLHRVVCDRGQMMQVLNNLIINARQAMPEGGKLQIHAENIVVGEGDTLPLASGAYVLVTIRDQGTGIPQDMLARIFDPYFTTKNLGTGLGLAVTYSVIQKHDGHIDVESEEGSGTVFRLYLPATSEQVAAELQTISEADFDGKRILVMDDEEIVRDVAQNILRELGCKVALAKEGAEAVAMYVDAMENGQPFDVVLMDLTIPGGMGGRETFDRLREIDPAVRVIISSGYSNDPVVSDYRELGMKAVLPKPYAVKDVRSVLCEAIAEPAEGVRLCD